MRRSSLALALVLAAAAAACNVPTVEGGSNANDRSRGGDQGETLLTGAMVVSPDGKYALMQRNQTSVLLDIEGQSAREMPEQVARFIFAKGGSTAVAVLQDGATVVSYELASGHERWRSQPELEHGAATMARLSDDGRYLVLGAADQVLVVDGGSGVAQGKVSVGSRPTELSFVPGTSRALVVGSTVWTNHLPSTAVVDVDLATLDSHQVAVPNCAAPIDVLPDASRAFLSPTFCEEDHASTPKQQWTNPDPVSVIDLAPAGPAFVKNLPGFGPTAMDGAGQRVVAYLDMKRIDESMFADKAQIPDKSGPRYHIMTINPKTLAFELAPVGEVLPRFALTRDGTSLLVDATVQQVRGEVSVKASITTSGVSVSASIFGGTDSLFGLFDLAAHTYTPFTGPAASLDRFVQAADGKHVFGLTMTADGLGGDLFRIDLETKSVTALGKSLRDIGLLPDGQTLLLRERLPAVQADYNGTPGWFRREQYSLSLDGINASITIQFQDSIPFQTTPVCSDTHDC
jgi:hypothetical protein